MFCRSVLITCFLALAIVQAASADTLTLGGGDPCVVSGGTGYSGGATPDNYSAGIHGTPFTSSSAAPAGCAQGSLVT